MRGVKTRDVTSAVGARRTPRARLTLALAIPPPFKRDEVRRIDRVIDYFGGTGTAGIRQSHYAGGQNMTGANGTVLALVDRAAGDGQVVREARTLAASGDYAVALLHVAPAVLHSVPRGAWATPRMEPWERMRAIEATIQHDLGELARRIRRHDVRVETLVRFGDPVEEVGRAASTVGAVAVVAASRPARWLPWRGRDHRLIRALDVPVVLVKAAGYRGHPRAQREAGARA